MLQLMPDTNIAPQDQWDSGFRISELCSQAPTRRYRGPISLLKEARLGLQSESSLIAGTCALVKVSGNYQLWAGIPSFLHRNHDLPTPRFEVNHSPPSSARQQHLYPWEGLLDFQMLKEKLKSLLPVAPHDRGPVYRRLRVADAARCLLDVFIISCLAAPTPGSGDGQMVDSRN